MAVGFNMSEVPWGPIPKNLYTTITTTIATRGGAPAVVVRCDAPAIVIAVVRGDAPAVVNNKPMEL